MSVLIFLSPSFLIQDLNEHAPHMVTVTSLRKVKASSSFPALTVPHPLFFVALNGTVAIIWLAVIRVTSQWGSLTFVPVGAAIDVSETNPHLSRNLNTTVHITGVDGSNKSIGIFIDALQSFLLAVDNIYRD